MKTILNPKMIIAGALFFSSLFYSCTKSNNNSGDYGTTTTSGGGGSTTGGYGNSVAMVSMQGNHFVPSSITVAVGTTVTWINKDNVTHTVTSEDNFSSGDVIPGNNYSYTFKTAGTYSYYCKYHKLMGMTGKIIVQ
jgi:plastocyanin